MSHIVVLARAEWDLEDCQDYLESQEVDLGKKFMAAFQQGVARIRQFPRRYAIYAQQVRICPLQPFKIGVFYRLEDKVVYVLRVLDLRRNPRRLRRDLGL